MEPHGTRLTLRITDPLDLNRDVLKVQLQLLFAILDPKILF